MRMRILHLGGFCFTVEAEAHAHKLAGHELLYLPAFRSEAIFVEQNWTQLTQAAEAFGAEMCFWHILKTAPEAELVLKLRSGSQQRFVFHSEKLTACASVAQDDICFASALPALQCPAVQASSWRIPALTLSQIERPTPYEPKWGEVRIFYIPYLDSDEDVQFTLSTVERLQSTGLRFLFAMIRPEDLSDRAFLTARIKECDIFLESLSLQYPGPLSYLAMAHGKTIMSGLSENARTSFEKFAKSPVINVTHANFEETLAKILRETKSLRDLGKRSRQFCETYCDAAHTPCLNVE